MKIYTKTGDKGQTSLYGDKRLSKSSLEVDALGSLDELNAFLGVAISNCTYKDIRLILISVQNTLFNIGAEIAMVSSTNIKTKKKFHLKKSKVTSVEKLIDKYTTKLEPLKNFILPGGTNLSSLLHYSRTVCRRAERKVVALGNEEKLNSNITPYLNRLSDLLFTLARFANKFDNVEDVLWIK